jgi:hypothetical protein
MTCRGPSWPDLSLAHGWQAATSIARETEIRFPLLCLSESVSGRFAKAENTLNQTFTRNRHPHGLGRCLSLDRFLEDRSATDLATVAALGTPRSINGETVGAGGVRRDAASILNHGVFDLAPSLNCFGSAE